MKPLANLPPEHTLRSPTGSGKADSPEGLLLRRWPKPRLIEEILRLRAQLQPFLTPTP